MFLVCYHIISLLDTIDFQRLLLISFQQASKMTGVKKATFGICTEDQLALDTLNKLGYYETSIIPWVGHKLFQYPLAYSLSILSI